MFQAQESPTRQRSGDLWVLVSFLTRVFPDMMRMRRKKHRKGLSVGCCGIRKKLSPDRHVIV